MRLYKNRKVKVCSPDGDTDFFDIVASVLQGDTLAPYLFIICLDLNIDRSDERKWFCTKKKARNRWYSAKTIRDADNVYDKVLLANVPTQAESLRHSLE